MNYPIISKILGRVMGLEAVLMVPSMITALCYGESLLWYAETAAIAAVLAVLLNLPGSRATTCTRARALSAWRWRGCS